MASLNLVPNPAVMAVQAGIFLTAIAIIKKLMLDPYMKLREKRVALTSGSQEDAENALAECDKISLTIKEKIQAAASEAKEAREFVREAALAKKTSILTDADQAVKSTVSKASEQIAAELAEEKQKIPAVVKAVSDQFYNVALN